MLVRFTVISECSAVFGPTPTLKAEVLSILNTVCVCVCVCARAHTRVDIVNANEIP